MNYFVHDHAICESTSVGTGTRVWGFAHVLGGAVLGEDCNICAHVFIENDVVIGSRVTVKPGVQLYDGIRIEDDVFIGPNATFTNDRFPRSKHYPDRFDATIVRRGASIGANATILSGIEIGEHAMIGAGAVVTRSVPANAIVTGNPGRISGYVDAMREAPTPAGSVDGGPRSLTSHVAGVTLHQLNVVRDIRGSLTVGDFADVVPFVPARFFMVFEVPTVLVRGEHAHRVCEQFLVCASGSVSVVVDDGSARQEILLDSSGVGIYLPPMIWGTQYRYSADATLVVFASHPYDPDDYIRDYRQFLVEKGIGDPPT